MYDTERLLLIATPLMTRTPAFDRAAALAKAQGAALHIVAFDYVDGLATAGMVNERALAEMREGYVLRHEKWLEEQAGAMHHWGITVTSEVVWVERPLEEILVHIKEMKPSMVIKDLVQESWLTRVLFTSLDLRLLHDCPVPLHLVTQVEHELPRKIVVAVDPFLPEEQFEQFNEKLIMAAEKLAEQCDAELHLLYAYDLSAIYMANAGFDFSGNVSQSLYEVEEGAFQQLADAFHVPAERRHLLMGRPERVIDDFARAQSVDVIVMGTVHRNRISQKLLGSTTEQVANHMPCSLLAINPLQSVE
ncbi:MAG: universal stress protein [Pseudomonas sp.]